MSIINNIRNYIFDNEYFMAFFEDKIYLYNVVDIIYISDSIIKLRFRDKIVIIKGKNINAIKNYNKEIVLSGVIESVSMNDDIIKN